MPSKVVKAVKAVKIAEPRKMKVDKSPMQTYIEAFDTKYIDWMYNEYWKNAKAQPFHIWNALFKNELAHRERHRNVVFSVEGEQGLGKSVFMMRLGGVISDTYGSKLDVENIHFFPDLFEKALSEAKHRTFYCMDEQPRIYGVMSNYVQDQLANYEDIFRKPQISIGYAAPRLRTHEHFFIFKALGDIEIYDDGSPASVSVMLMTKRKSDDMIMPRAMLKFSWADKKLWTDYERRKDQFIGDFKAKKDPMMGKIAEDADRVVQKWGDKMFVDSAKGVKKIVNRSTLDFYVYDVVGMRAYTMEGMRMLREAVKQKALVQLEAIPS